jgi:hypothetical protein
MFAGALADLRSRFENSGKLGEWFASNYPGVRLYVTVGLRPEVDENGRLGTAIPRDLFPYIALSVQNQKRTVNPRKQRSGDVSIMFGLHDERCEDGIYTGAVALEDLAELILAEMEQQPTGIGHQPKAVWDGEADIAFDAWTVWPYLEGEITITLQARE